MPDWGRLLPARSRSYRTPPSLGAAPNLPQTKQQKEVEARLKEKADTLGKKMGMNRREFLRSASGMAAAFLAMNEVHGHVFNVDPAEAADIEMAEAVRAVMRCQFILDDQTHFVRCDYAW